MARGRPRKDGSKPKEKEVEPDPEMIQEGARTKRKAATACIKSVMNRYNITPSDVIKDDIDQVASDNDNSSKLVKSQSGDNDPSDQVSKHDETAGGVSEEGDKTPCDAKCDAISAEKPSPSKNWAQSIWGSPSSSGSVIKPPGDSKVDDPKEESVPHQEMCSVKKSSNITEKQPSSSSGSTPSTSGTGTPRSETPEVAASSKKPKSSNKKSKAKVRRRIRTLSDMDSEDSEVSTDSPLKPKEYSEAKVDTSESASAPVLRSKRIPRKAKEVAKPEGNHEKQSSPVEEPPLIPKGFLEQQRKEQELKDKESDAKAYVIEKKLAMSAEDRAEVDKRIKSFKQLKENQYLCKRVVNKQSKKMQCDCSYSKEEMSQGEKGCGDDCINRLLYIECGKPCLLESNCSNKRFQNNQYADVEVFKTDWKGVGLRARKYIPKDTFIMEYVGEVLDSRLFKKRARQYTKDEVQHFYFMALSKDQFVDATCKGNISRFINHSCDPNSETQKWTVNGEIRVGFFTKRSLQPGEEVSFDYKYERYGNVAQKCYCGTAQCRGWLGGEPGSDSGIEEAEDWSEEDDEDDEIEVAETVKKEKKKKEKKRKDKKGKKMEVDDTEDEIQKLEEGGGIRNRNHTLQLCRLMVRATRLGARLKLADMLFEADQPCLRLFLDYQGLRILYSWMFELEWSVEELELKLRIETVLSQLPIPHKTILVDSKVLQTVEKWRLDSPTAASKDEGVESAPASRVTSPTPTGSTAASPREDKEEGMEVDHQSSESLCPPGEEPSSDTMPSCVQTSVGEVLAAQAGVADQVQDTLELEDVSMEDVTVKPVGREELPLTEEEERMRDDQSKRVETEEPSLEEQMVADIQGRAAELLEAWSGLQEMFKIPKKERQAVRREHEREADRDRETGTGQRDREEREPRRLSTSSSSTRHPGYRGDRYPETRDREAGAVRGGFVGNRKNLRLDDRTGRLQRANLHRDDRRMLFQAKVEEENRQRVMREAIFARHDQCCRLLGMIPAVTPMLPKYPEFYLLNGKWVPMPAPPHPIDPTWTPPMMAALPPNAFKPSDPPLPNPRSVYPPGCYPELPPEALVTLDQSESEADICQFYDKLYYGSLGQPVPQRSYNSTPSPVAQAHKSPLSEAISAQLDRTKVRYPGELSPDYRSPSPVSRTSPPTSLQFLSSNPQSEVTVLQSSGQDISAAHQEQSLQYEANIESLPASSSLQVEPEAQGINRDAAEGGGLVVRIPPRWRAARDASGRVYYYHTVTKETSWDIPSEEHHEEGESEAQGRNSEEFHRMETNDTDSDEDRDEDGDDTDTEEDSEEENEENGGGDSQEPEPSEIPDSDLSASEKRMLLRMRTKTKEERRNMRRMKREKFKERHEAERMVTRERHKRHRRDGLVMEHLVPARISDKDKVDLMTFKEMRERLLNKDKIREQQLKEEREEEEKERREERARVDKIRREEKKARRESDIRPLAGEETLDVSVNFTPSQDVSLNLTLTPSTTASTPQAKVTSSSEKKPRTTQAAADTSSDTGEKKNKDKFLKEMSKMVVKILDPYRKKGVKGHIGNTDDFKHLAKKFTYTIMQKELKVCKSIDELKANEKVKKKASDYVNKYMKKYEREYKRSPDQDQE